VWVAVGYGMLGAALVALTVWLWREAPLGSRWLLVLLWVGVLARAAALPADRYLSDDAHRYHWDGKVLSHGINPYRHPPDDPALDPLREHTLDTRINHPQHRTVYPPVAQLYFAAGYLLTPGRLLGIQLLALLGEVVAWALLLLELARRRLPRAPLLLASWAPLAVLEGYLPGHVDVLMLPWLTLFVLALARGWAVLAGVALGLSCLVKPWPLIFALVAWRQLGTRRALRLAGAAVATLLLFYLPFLSAGGHLFSSLWLMATRWSNNASLVELLRLGLSPAASRLVAAALLAGLLVAGVHWGRGLRNQLLLSFTAFVICTPNLFPWYLLPALPLLVLRPDPALLTLVALVPLTEVVNIGWQIQRRWDPPSWSPWAVYLPFFGLLILEAWRGWGMFSRQAANAEAASHRRASPGGE
jgi:hypothetical protein